MHGYEFMHSNFQITTMVYNRVIFWYLIVVASDILTTYLGSPTLEHETSFVVSVLNFGWTAIFIHRTIEAAILILLDKYSRKKLYGLQQDSLSVIEASKAAFNFLSINLLKMETLLVFFGFLAIRLSIYFHGIATLNNMIYFVYLNHSQSKLYKLSKYYYAFDYFVFDHAGVFYDYLLSIPIALIVALAFFRKFGSALVVSPQSKPLNS
jgi:hypothetical protein